MTLVVTVNDELLKEKLRLQIVSITQHQTNTLTTGI